MAKFLETIKQSKTALNLARDIFSEVQKPGVCEYYDKQPTTVPGALVKCRHNKNEKMIEAKDGKPARSIRLSCTLHNCPFVNSK